MGRYGQPWVDMGCHGDVMPWAALCSHGQPWAAMDSHEQDMGADPLHYVPAGM